ncbi:hypothetical protein [Flammeovirga sp. OC4]|uniref:hypothetical protein n=1 Tax=Flammeovirga sp. OC4 TaxID=1382345 RepID=UPI0005C662F4|nr:hypothetical protein [Flammeovirga sp. OC4]
MKIKLISILTLLLFQLNVSYGSHQFGDYIVYQGDTSITFNFFLENYLKKVTKDNGKLFGLSFRENATFNCWRGYQAIYLIENDSLFLTDIITPGEIRKNKTIDKEKSQSKITEIFKDKIVNNRVLIDWYSGSFIIAKGDVLRRNAAVPKTFERELSVIAEKGNIIEKTMINNYEEVPNGISRRYSDKPAPDDVILEEIKKLKKREIEDCLGGYNIIIGTNGKISEVSRTFQIPEGGGLEKLQKEAQDLTTQKIANHLASLSFDIVKHKGVPVEEKVDIIIFKLENEISYFKHF